MRAAIRPARWFEIVRVRLQPEKHMGPLNKTKWTKRWRLFMGGRGAIYGRLRDRGTSTSLVRVESGRRAAARSRSGARRTGECVGTRSPGNDGQGVVTVHRARNRHHREDSQGSGAAQEQRHRAIMRRANDPIGCADNDSADHGAEWPSLRMPQLSCAPMK